MQVVDLFCGLGGFSAGAIDAGATVILGADKDSVPLKLWAANVPGGTHEPTPTTANNSWPLRLETDSIPEVEPRPTSYGKRGLVGKCLEVSPTNEL